MERTHARRSALAWAAAVAAGVVGVAASIFVIPLITAAVRSGFLFVPEATFNSWMNLLLNRLFYFLPFVVLPAVAVLQLLAGAVGTACGSARAAKMACTGAYILMALAGLVTAFTLIGAMPPWETAAGLWTLIHGAVAVVACFGVLTLTSRAAQALRPA